MKVSELIAKLQQMPQDAEVRGYYDSACRQDLALVFSPSEKLVVFADSNDRDEIATFDFPSAKGL